MDTGSRCVPWWVTALVAIGVGTVGSAWAFEIETGHPDVSIRWDNTLRYNAGWRMEDRDARLAANPASDESTYKFGKKDLVTNRIDIFSEFDVIYKRNLGFRISGAAWYDQAYQDTNAVQNPTFAALGVPSSYEGSRYSAHIRRWYRGPSGEFLDAFLFANLDIGGIPLNIKAGQHAIYWGQSLFYLGGVSYSQSPVDLRKALANPGSEIKELFLPLKQISLQSQMMPNLSVAAQYYFDWKPYRAPEGGTYFGMVDFALAGPDRTGVVNPMAPGFEFLPRGAPVEPDRTRGNWGVSAKWTPEFMAGGSFGFHYRKFDEKLPWLFLDPVAFSSYRAVYPRDTKIYGVSVDSQVGPLSVGAELAYRENAALLTPLFSPVNEGARGNTWHSAINAIYVLPKTAVWETGTLVAELHYSRLAKVSANEALFQGVGRAACMNPLTMAPGSGDKNDGCATKTAWGMDVAFTPQWPQVAAGVDLSLPITLGYQIAGNEAGLAAGAYNEGSFNYSVGVEADIRQRVKIRLAYNDYGGRISREIAGTWASVNGQSALLQDRGWLSLTVKASF